MTPDLRQHPDIELISHLCVQNGRFCRYRQSGPKTLSFRREMFYLTRTNVFLTFFIKSNPILPFFLWQPRFWDKNPLIWVQNVDFPQNPRNHSKSTSKSGNPSPKTNLTPSFRREYCVLTNVWILWSIYYIYKNILCTSKCDNSRTHLLRNVWCRLIVHHNITILDQTGRI